MNLKLQHRNLEVSSELRKIIERRSRKTQKILPTFSSRDLHLHITLEKLPRKNQCRTVLVLTTPQKALRVADIEDTPKASLLRSFDELLRKVEKFKSQLNRERLWHRQIVTSSLKPSGSRENELQDALIQNLDTLENFIRRELSHRVITESLPPTQLDPQALMDEVVLEAISRSNQPGDLPFKQWLFQLARDKLQNRITTLIEARDEPHIEEPIRIPARWEDEVLNFYQPDEALCIEDILPDERSNNPEEWIAEEESQRQLRRAIARLPRPIREPFILFALEGFNWDEVAMITGTTPGEVIENVEKARMELRQALQ